MSDEEGTILTWADFERVDHDSGEITYESFGYEAPDHESGHDDTFIRISGSRAKDVAEKIYNSLQARWQEAVGKWTQECFGAVISSDKTERNHRFLEEALELVQVTGCTKSEAHQLVDYVYGRDVGEIKQEVGGVMITLAGLCLANNIDMQECAEAELSRVWENIEKIREKQAAKPKHSPLPQLPEDKK